MALGDCSCPLDHACKRGLATYDSEIMIARCGGRCAIVDVCLQSGAPNPRKSLNGGTVRISA